MLQKVKLGNSEIKLSRLGLGTVKFGRNQGVKYPKNFDLPSDAKIANLLAHAQNLGINLLDTAPAYGDSEAKIGRLLSNRNNWILCTKAGEQFINGQSYYDFSKEALIQSIEQSLRRLNTDYLDIVLIHSNGHDINIIENDGALDSLCALKKKGMIRAIGMSTKTVEGGLLALQYADVMMLVLNAQEQRNLKVIEQAHQDNKGVLIKKAFSSGHLAAGLVQVSEQMHFIFSHPGVSSVVTGTLSSQHLEQNAQVIIQILSGVYNENAKYG